MKAAIYEEFGPPDVLNISEIDEPTIDDDEVLIKTHSTSVNMIDIVFRSGMKVMFGLVRFMTGIRSPKRKVLGFDIAGEIIQVGKNVTAFEIGDQVYGGARSGANAEYSKSGVNSIAKLPSRFSYPEAGVVPVAALSALQGLRDQGRIISDQDVLIYGASGGIGTYAVQLAKYFGATVTGIASGKNENTVRGLGADYFINYTETDFTQQSEKYDLIFDTVGKSPQSRWKHALKDNGIFVNAGSPYMSMTRFFFNKFGNKFRNKQYRSFDTKYKRSDLELLANIADEGKLRSVIDKTYSLDDIVEAHRYYEKGHTVGKISVMIDKEF